MIDNDDIGALATSALELFLEAVAQVPADRWDEPSNLADWTVRELVGHATGSAAKIVALMAGQQVWGRSQPEDWTSSDPVARLRTSLTLLQDSLPAADLEAPRPSPQGEVPLRRALCFPVADLALHSWDVHRSLGRQSELPPELLTFCRELVQSIPEDLLRKPGAFGPACPAPADATPTTQLLAHLGRTV